MRQNTAFADPDAEHLADCRHGTMTLTLD